MTIGLDEEEVVRRAMDEREGSRYVVRRIVLPFVRATRDDLLVALRDMLRNTLGRNDFGT